MIIVAILKHIASKNADYGKSLEYLMFEHTENGTPIRDAEGNMRMRERFILDGINCNPFSYDKDCERVNAQYHKNQKYSDIKSHHYIISFDPQDCEDGKLTAEQAQALGLEFARRHFPGHQIIVCTHTDGHNESGNIHVHIIFNSVRKLDVEKEPFMDRDIDCRAGYKHHLTKGYLEYLQAEVMGMCEREGLHQVDLLSPAKSKISDREYRAKQRRQEKLDELNAKIVAAKMKPRTTVFQTQKQYLRDAILDIASQTASIEEFRDLLSEKYGIALKDHRGRFSYLHPDRLKFITGKSLGSDFEKEHILEMLLESDKRKEAEKDKSEQKEESPGRENAGNADITNPQADQPEYDPSYDYHADPVAILYVRSHLRLVVDLQTNIKAQQSAAYARKVKLSNLKEMARTVVFIQENGFDTAEDLHHAQRQLSEKSQNVRAALDQTDAALKDINERIHYTGQYNVTKKVQQDFLKARFKKKYREDHKDELDKYAASVSFFRKHYEGQIPSMKQLKAEKEKLLTLQKEQKKELAVLGKQDRLLQTASTNVDAILHAENVPTRRKPSRQPEL